MTITTLHMFFLIKFSSPYNTLTSRIRTQKFSSTLSNSLPHTSTEIIPSASPCLLCSPTSDIRSPIILVFRQSCSTSIHSSKSPYFTFLHRNVPFRHRSSIPSSSTLFIPFSFLCRLFTVYRPG
ncbi:hypothetical protein FRC03_007456 [Tulasnella sp. 419]|nr:hypothetical protein FRC03_007456 [Tulasnella sp. 419]